MPSSSSDSDFENLRNAVSPQLNPSYYTDQQLSSLRSLDDLILDNEERGARQFVRANPMDEEMDDMRVVTMRDAQEFTRTRTALAAAWASYQRHPDSARRENAHEQAALAHDAATAQWIETGMNYCTEISRYLDSRDEDVVNIAQGWMDERPVDLLTPDQRENLRDGYQALAMQRVTRPTRAGRGEDYPGAATLDAFFARTLGAGAAQMVNGNGRRAGETSQRRVNGHGQNGGHRRARR